MYTMKYYSLNSVVNSHLSLGKYRIFDNYYRQNYRYRWLKKKSTSLILFWSFSASLMGNYFLNSFFYSGASLHWQSPSWLLPLAAFIYPISGWLADVYFGRYKVIKAGVIVMCIGAVLVSVLEALHVTVVPSWPPYVYISLKVCIYLLLFVGFSGFQLNIVQFAIDQLMDHSSSEIISFTWIYVWTLSASDVSAKFMVFCSCRSVKVYVILLIPFLLILTLLSDLTLNQWLVKEPATQNPLQLIFRVLKYAIRNSHPRQRSAFTYCNNRPYSRLDLAKSKYGGPFTTEEVEDVKTFFRNMSIIVIISVVVGLFVNMEHMSNKSISFNFRYFDSSPLICTGIIGGGRMAGNSTLDQHCFTHFIASIGSSLVFLSIPISEFIVTPCLAKYLRKLKIMVRFLLGIMLILLHMFSLLGIELIGEGKWHKKNSNKSLSCAMSPHVDGNHDDYGISIGWLTVPSILSSVGNCFIAVAIIEFISAQSPYSMKGLMFGLVYFTTTASFGLFYSFSVLFQDHASKLSSNLGCMFWFLLASTVLMAVLVLAFLIACCYFKNRQRDDILPNQHCFAESYYERHLSNDSRKI